MEENEEFVKKYRAIEGELQKVRQSLNTLRLHVDDIPDNFFTHARIIAARKIINDALLSDRIPTKNKTILSEKDDIKIEPTVEPIVEPNVEPNVEPPKPIIEPEQDNSFLHISIASLILITIIFLK
jgi:hypothetical protein